MIRIIDIIIASSALIIFFPLLLLISIVIKLTSKGPIFYKQVRVGLNGFDFNLYKFRSMCIGADKRGLLTVGDKDRRITTVGYFIRKYKLDEIPQLINVLIGDMSIVGPRPEVRKYVDKYDDHQKKILSIKPGITDIASIKYKNENKILAMSKNPEFHYINIIMPDKIKYNFQYINNYSLKEYFKIIFATISALLINRK